MQPEYPAGARAPDNLSIDLTKRFDYHKPDRAAASRIGDVRWTLKNCAQMILAYTPQGREQSLAITAIEEAMFWAIAAIAREGFPPVG